jgi:hypothetical protein
MLEARDDLTDIEYRWLVQAETQQWGAEAARLLRGDMLRAERGEDWEQAA